MNLRSLIYAASLLLFLLQMSSLQAQIKSNSDDAVFTPEEEIILSVTRADTDSNKQTTLLVKNFYDETVIKLLLAWKEGQKEMEVPVNIKAQGYFEAMLSNGKIENFKYPFAIIPMPGELANQDNPLGVNFHLTRISLKNAKREMAMAKRIGFGWGRGMLFDIGVFNKKTDFSNPACFARWKNLTDAVKDSGLSCLGGVYYFPAWISGAPAGSEYNVFSRIAPDDFSDVVQYCKSTAKYCSFVKYWEVGNESDANNFWRGRWENNLSGNDKKIIEDYVDFLKAAASGFRQGNPASKILFTGITSDKDDGHTYRPFVATAFNAGAGDVIDVMNIHYSKKIADIHKLTNNMNKPIWVTELGATSANNNDYGEIIADTTQTAIQLADGAEKVFKYDFRDDGVKPDEREHNFGLVRRDFSPKPAYAAYATTIRMLKTATFNKALNVTGWAEKGWLRGYEFNDYSRRINCLWLNNADRSKIILRTDEPELTFINIMGNSKTLKPRNGVIETNIDKLPFFIIGSLKPDAGKVVLPADKLVGETLLPVINAHFEQEMDSSKIPYWRSDIEISKVSLSCTGYNNSNAAEIKVNKPGPDDFIKFYQEIDWIKCTPKVKEGEYLKLSLQAVMKSDKVFGRGVSLNCEFFDSNGKRLKWAETSYRGGTYEWKELKVKSCSIPPETASISVSLYFAPKTYGKVEIDNIKLYLERWEKAEVKRSH